jgi:rhodanese-related sulfurtransferase
VSNDLAVYVVVGLILALTLRKWYVARIIQQYRPSEVQKQLSERNDVVLLDVRTDRERRSRHIKGSLHIPLHELLQRAHELEEHRNKEIICYCQSGSRSVSAAMRLRKLGFAVANMKGGITGWSFPQRT